MFEWSSVLVLAQELAGRDASDEVAEASWRAGASRAYFAAYNAAKDYLAELEGWRTPRVDSHQELFKYLEGLQSHSKMHRQVAATLGRLRSARNSADYDREPSFGQVRAHQAILDARKTLDLVDGLRAQRAARK